MKKSTSNFLIATFTMLSLNALAEDFYTVRPGETLSDILFAKEIGPIYGKYGNLQKMLALNPKLKNTNGDKLIPGMKIRLVDYKAVEIDYNLPVAENENLLPAISARSVASDTAIHDPTPEKKNEEISEFQQYSFFKLSPDFSWVAINSVNDVNLGGTDVSNITSPGFGAKGEWRIVIYPETSLYVFSSLNLIKFYEDSAYSLTSTRFNRTSFGIGGEYGLSESLNIATDFQVNQNYFLEVVNPTNIQIRTLTQMELKTQFSKGLFKIGRVKSDLGLGGMILFPTTRNDYKAKLGYGLNIDWRTKFLSKEIEISYIHKIFRVNEIKNQSKEIFVKMLFNLGYEK